MNDFAVWPALTVQEAAAELRADIAARKAELLMLEKERAEELANARYGEDYYGAMYSAPERYRLDCGCVYSVRTAQWEKECERHWEVA